MLISYIKYWIIHCIRLTTEILVGAGTVTYTSILSYTGKPVNYSWKNIGSQERRNQLLHV